MKGPTPRIVLLGNNSGRNLGDAAILASIMDILSKEIRDAEFIVPSTHPHFIRKHYGHLYNVTPVNVMPWTGSLRLLGIPTFYHMARSDIALICDGIIFGKKILNPAFNFLITLVFVVAWAKLFNTKVVCYSCGIGPFPSAFSRWCAKWVLNLSDLIIMRERDSEKLARDLGVSKPIEVTGDAAFLNKVSSDERAGEILAELNVPSDKPLLGINITKYFDTWLEKNERLGSREAFLDTLVSSIKAAEARCNARALVFSTQPMDEEVCKHFAARLGTTVVDNSRYLSHDIQSVMKRCELFIGMRFHSVVLASAVETPIIGLVYAPKVRGFMRFLESEPYSLELAQLSTPLLTDTIVRAWNERRELKAKQKHIVDRLKDGARRAAVTVRERYYPDLGTAEEAQAANA